MHAAAEDQSPIDSGGEEPILGRRIMPKKLLALAITAVVMIAP
jgi:hypothetical protein